ncbi:helix-turn-helix domain-containing protein [Pseudoxanthomonas winnipegensis]|uniref:helix-turn-helix domain-containing protein n=1 Tax=Pseudoxanthomonas winnipegensis TaxID=2480810 RepID=UPI003CE4EEF7
MLGGMSAPPLSIRLLLAKRVRELRKAAGWSQTELGVRMGFSESNSSAVRISRYESGDSAPGLDTIKQLAAALGVSASYLVAETEELAEWIRHFDAASAKERKALLESIGARREGDNGD